MAYEFHYTPTGTGVISGKEVLEQTEDAINDLGNTAISGVQEALDKAEQALTNSENAVDDAQTALNTANNAEGVAIQARNDVSNLSGTVTNLGNRVTTAEGNIGNLQGRMTTAEGNITNLQGRMTTAEGNIGNLQTAVSTAQATANSAQQTATTARQQSYVLRYSSTTLVASSTNSNSLLDNTDNLKVGDKVIDSSGVIYSVTTIDTANSTFTIGTSLIDLAQDSDVVHKSGDETIGGEKSFDSNTYIYNSDNTATTPILFLKNSKVSKSSTSETGAQLLKFVDKNNSSVGELESVVTNLGASELRLKSNTLDSNNQNVQTGVTLISNINGAKRFCPTSNGNVSCGYSTLKWSSVYATNYYYGDDNVEFSTKFVTTDTNQTINGNKTFGNGTLIVNNGIGSNVHGEIKLNGSRSGYIVADNTSDGVFGVSESGVSILLQDPNKPLHIGAYKTDSNERVFADNTNKNPVLSITGSLVKTSVLVPENDTVNSIFRILSELKYANGNPSKTLDVRFIQYDNATTNAIYSNDNGKTSLGISSKKWSDVLTYKVNGVEPSSLSLPNYSSRIDISSYITNLNGTYNAFTPSVDGWIAIQSSDATFIRIADTGSGGTGNTTTSQNAGILTCMMPVRANRQSNIYIVCTTLTSAYFIPCQGNV